MILLLVAYNSGDIFVTFILARLSFFSTTVDHPLVVLWAPFLLLHLAGPDNIAAYSLQDDQLWRRSLQAFLSHVTAGGYFLYTYTNISGDFIRLASRLMFVVGVVKYGERWLAVKKGNLGSIHDSVKKQRVDAMNSTDVQPQDVKFKKSIEGSEILDEESSVRRAHLLFHICKSSMAHYGEDQPNTLNCKEKMNHVEFWTIVEIELSLMYDILYTKAAVIHTWHGYTIRVISPFVILTSLLLFHFSEEDEHREVDAATTYVLFGSALFMDWISLLNALGSSWMFATLSTTRSTWLRNIFLRSGLWDRLRRILIALRSLVTCGGSSRSGARRWSGHMGQYNMLHFCTRPNTPHTRPLLGRLAKLVGLGDLWNKKHFSGTINLSGQLSVSIKNCINNHIDHLYKECGLNTLGMIKHEWGMTSLVRNNLDDKFHETLGHEFEEGIIIWHIGTEFYLSMCNAAAGESVVLVKAIMALSNYMMFLLVEQPYMLPGNAQNQLYERTCKALEGVVRHYHPTGICAVLKSVFRWRDAPAGYTSMPTNSRTHAGELYTMYAAYEVYTPYQQHRLTYSAAVAEELLRYEKEHGTTKSLQLLLEVWTDMLVYAGNKCSRESHAKKLSSGGELTTIVWLMLEHFHQIALGHDRNQGSAQEEHFDQIALEEEASADEVSNKDADHKHWPHRAAGEPLSGPASHGATGESSSVPASHGAVGEPASAPTSQGTAGEKDLLVLPELQNHVTAIDVEKLGQSVALSSADLEALKRG